MKIQITFKDPDAVSNAIQDHVAHDVRSLLLDRNDALMVEAIRTEKANEALTPWIRGGEYLEVEFDTEAKTATVIPNR